MNYYKKGKEVFAFEDDQLDLVTDEFVAMTDAEIELHLNPPITPEQLIEEVQQKRLALRSIADSEIEWRQDAVDVDIATSEEVTALAAWKKYRVLLMRVDTAAPVWPTVPVV